MQIYRKKAFDPIILISSMIRMDSTSNTETIMITLQRLELYVPIFDLKKGQLIIK